MREISILKQRILEYLAFKGISKYECYKNTGITNGVLSQNNGMSEENLLRFLSCYSDVNPTWLILGKGNMLIEELKQQDPITVVSHESDAYYKMYEKKDAEASALKEEVGMLKERIKQLETNMPTGRIEQQRAMKETML